MEQAAPPDPAQEQPLPAGLVRQLAGWSSRAQQYPVFSRTWFRYRVRAYLLPLALLTLFLLLLLLLIPAGVSEAAVRFALFSVWLIVVSCLFPGRGLAVLVRQRGWPRRRETVSIALSLLSGIVVAAWFTQFTRVQSGARPSPALAMAGDHHAAQLFNLALWLVLLLWLGGGFDFLSYLRQRRGLQDAGLREQMERYKDERNQAAMRLSVLASQVEPHFLFNTLSGVRAAILSDPARGVAIIDHLVDYLRATIPQIRSEGGHLLVALRGQLDAARSYLGVIHARSPRLSFRVDCPDALQECAIPPLMLISLVENAVRHGIEPKKGPVEIIVSARRQMVDGSEKLLLSVADDGVGFGAGGNGNNASGSGIGLSNIRERLRYLYGDQAALRLSAREAGGLEACLVLPLQALPREQPPAQSQFQPQPQSQSYPARRI